MTEAEREAREIQIKAAMAAHGLDRQYATWYVNIGLGLPFGDDIDPSTLTS